MLKTEKSTQQLNNHSLKRYPVRVAPLFSNGVAGTLDASLTRISTMDPFESSIIYLIPSIPDTLAIS
jgi:hypothetical protein